MHFNTFGDDEGTVDVGRPDMPVTQTSVDPITGMSTMHVTGIEPASVFFSSDPTTNASSSSGSSSSSSGSSGSSGSSSGGGGSFLDSLSKLFSNTSTPTPAASSGGIPSWLLIGGPLVLGGALLMVAGSGRHRRPAYAGYSRRRRSRKGRR